MTGAIHRVSTMGLTLPTATTGRRRRGPILRWGTASNFVGGTPVTPTAPESPQSPGGTAPLMRDHFGCQLLGIAPALSLRNVSSIAALEAVRSARAP